MYAFHYCLTTAMRNRFFDGRGFAEDQSGLLWSISEKYSKLLIHMVYLDHILHTYVSERGRNPKKIKAAGSADRDFLVIYSGHG